MSYHPVSGVKMCVYLGNWQTAKVLSGISCLGYTHNKRLFTLIISREYKMFPENFFALQGNWETCYTAKVVGTSLSTILFGNSLKKTETGF